MATSVHYSSATAASQEKANVAGQIAGRALSEPANDSPSLFTNPQHEPLVEPAAPWVMPRTAALGAVPRAFDVTVAVTLIILLWPVMLGAALLVRVTSPGPIIFRHVRIGQNGSRFECLKFRTMNNGADRVLAGLLGACGAMRSEWGASQKIRCDPRVTAVGQVLRRFSVDELPQLFNVLRGEMSIVGPRPIVDAEIQRYADKFADYCLVKPGLTGLWQVSGRNSLPYERRVELDCQYARTKSLRGDAWIIVRTVPVVLQGSGC
jgi:exopolysaccharide production protein ExoY